MSPGRESVSSAVASSSSFSSSARCLGRGLSSGVGPHRLSLYSTPRVRILQEPNVAARRAVMEKEFYSVGEKKRVLSFRARSLHQETPPGPEAAGNHPSSPPPPPKRPSWMQVDLNQKRKVLQPWEQRLGQGPAAMASLDYDVCR